MNVFYDFTFMNSNHRKLKHNTNIRIPDRIKLPNRIYIMPLINEILLWLYTFGTIFNPYDNFMLKKGSFVLLIAINIINIINQDLNEDETAIVYLFGIVLPVYTIFKSYVLTHNLIGNLLSGYTGMIVLLYFIIKKYNINFVRILNVCLLLLAFFLCFSALMDVLGIMTVFQNPVLHWMHNTENADIGRGSQYFMGYYLFIKTTPMMIVGIPYQMMKKKYHYAIILLIALVLSGTRANAILGMGVFFVCYIIKEKKLVNRVGIIGLAIAFAVFCLIKFDLISVYMDYARTKGSGDKIREYTLPSIFMSWKLNPISFFTGQGYTSSFYNFGRQRWEDDVELAYWNLLRRVGFWCFIAMMAGYIAPAVHLLKKKKLSMMLIAYLAYMVGCYVNPLLYTSTGVTILLYMFCVSYRNADTRRSVIKSIFDTYDVKELVE